MRSPIQRLLCSLLAVAMLVLSLPNAWAEELNMSDFLLDAPVIDSGEDAIAPVTEEAAELEEIVAVPTGETAVLEEIEAAPTEEVPVAEEETTPTEVPVLDEEISESAILLADSPLLAFDEVDCVRLAEDYTFSQNQKIPASCTLYIEGGTVTIPTGVTVTNLGNIVLRSGTLIIAGTLANNSVLQSMGGSILVSGLLKLSSDAHPGRLSVACDFNLTGRLIISQHCNASFDEGCNLVSTGAFSNAGSLCFSGNAQFVSGTFVNNSGEDIYIYAGRVEFLPACRVSNSGRFLYYEGAEVIGVEAYSSNMIIVSDEVELHEYLEDPDNGYTVIYSLEHVTLTSDLTVPEGKTLEIYGSRLRTDDWYVYNNGTITITNGMLIMKDRSHYVPGSRSNLNGIITTVDPEVSTRYLVQTSDVSQNTCDDSGNRVVTLNMQYSCPFTSPVFGFWYNTAPFGSANAPGYQVVLSGENSSGGIDVPASVTFPFSKAHYVFVDGQFWPEAVYSLESGTTYYYCAWIEDPNIGIIYGEQKSFTTLSVDQFPITYVLNGGINSPENPAVFSSLSTLKLSAPSRAGHAFTGWFTDAECTHPVTAISQGTIGGITLYAGWQQLDYTITYVLDGGTNSLANPDSYTVSAEELFLAEATRVGYHFQGWYTDFSSEPTTCIPAGSTGDLTFYAKWIPIGYSVLLLDDSASGQMSVISMTYDVPQALPISSLSRSGYVFLGWGLPGNPAVSFADGETVLNLTAEDGGSVILESRWEPIIYSIAFDGNGSDSGEMTPIFKTYDVPVTLPENEFVRHGYHFIGWNTDAKGRGRLVTSGDKNLTLDADSTVTLYAQWSINEFSVRFDRNGGTSGTMKEQTFTYGITKRLAANTFKRTGYTFIGWSLEPDGGVVLQNKDDGCRIADVHHASVTLYAVWKPNSYILAFQANGANGDMESVVCQYGTDYTLPSCNFSREGFHFIGWAVCKNGTPAFSDCGTIRNLATSQATTVTLYAQWRAGKYSIYFDGNGAASGTMSPRMNLVCGKSYTLTANAYKRPGYTFIGWNTQPDGSGTAYTDRTKKANFCTEDGSALVLYAQWKPTEYRISYKGLSAGDCNPNPDTYTVESGIISLAAPEPSANFDGWFTSSSLREKYRITEIHPNQMTNITLYPKWQTSTATYTIRFDSNAPNGVEIRQTASVMAKCKFTKLYTLKSNPFRAVGYTFCGWNTAPDGSGQSFANGARVSRLTPLDGGTVTLYAQWLPTLYTLTYQNVLPGEFNPNPTVYTVESTNLVLQPIDSPSFAGWYTSPSFTAASRIESISTDALGNKKIYARWTGSYQVVFDCNAAGISGTVKGTMKPMKNKMSDKYKLTANAFKAVGYHFTGWNTAPDGSGTAYTNRASVCRMSAVPGSTVTLYAQWSPVTYDLIYKNIGSAAYPEKTTYTSLETFELPIPTRQDYIFSGWYTTATYKSGTQLTTIPNGTTGKLILYACWILEK